MRAMEMDLRLQNLAERVRAVLGCSSVSLLLECSDPALRHPLLSSPLVKNGQTALPTLTTQTMLLLQDERVRALYDMAMQTGLLWCIDSIHVDTMNTSQSVQSVAIAPLERPDGILGFFLCTSAQPGAFYFNRCTLLEQRLPDLASQLEWMLKRYSEQSRITSSGLSIQKAAESSEATLEMREQSSFISLVSHELRVPLTAIKGYAGLLQAYSLPVHAEGKNEHTSSSMMTAEKQQQYLDVIMEQTCHMEVLVNDLLDLSKLQSGRFTLRCMPIDLSQVCQRVVEIAQRRIETQHPVVHTLRYQSAPSLPPVWADPDRVEQILTNLVDNAIKYSPDGGPIEIAVTSHEASSQSSSWSQGTQNEDDAPMLTVTVRDKGIGMSQQEQCTAFHPFTRGEHPSVEKIAGSGLGLYLSRILIEAMNGTLSLDSCKGQGTSIAFTLPIVPVDARTSAADIPPLLCGKA